MPIISHMGVDYDSPNIQIQDNASATDLDNTKIPTGQTVESYIDSKKYSYTGTGAYISTFTLDWYIIGKACMFTCKFKTNTNISNSTGWSTISSNDFPYICNDMATARPSEIDAANILRDFEIIHNSGSYAQFRALGAYTAGTWYYASGAFIVS